MKLASSDAKKAMAAACSSGKPRRRMACWFRMSCHFSPVIFGLCFVAFVGRDPGPDELPRRHTVSNVGTAWRHRVDPDAIAAIFHCQHLAQRQYATFAGCVRGAV